MFLQFGNVSRLIRWKRILKNVGEDHIVKNEGGGMSFRSIMYLFFEIILYWTLTMTNGLWSILHYAFE